MEVREYVKQFEQLGFGLFVHYGLYSQAGQGEWYMHLHNVPQAEYERLLQTFAPRKDWAKKLARIAKCAGCRYITLTTRHHDGFSLYDTRGLNDYDAPNVCGRDLVREFVDACNDEGLIPFFYHTLLDWREKSYTTDFKAYLVYLRKSVEILCTQYGKIGGIWFDGMWDRPHDDWEEDALYGMIRAHQPTAMIINNTGLNAQGELGHDELDSVTFERGRPAPINQEHATRYVASEVCQTLNSHWGYAVNDYRYASLPSLITCWCECRKYGANFLLNVGPKEDGTLRALDQALLEELGKWAEIAQRALYQARPCKERVVGNDKDFLLRGKNGYYLFCFDLPMRADPNVERQRTAEYVRQIALREKVLNVSWLDEPQKTLAFTQTEEGITLNAEPFEYGKNLVVRIAEIRTE